jgi:TPP-dependent 2-oxoacid decarboxylase
MLTTARFVICNEGYTIERYIHGWDAGYNDIQPWEFANIPKVFGAKDNYQGYRIKTRDELNQLFADETFNVSDKLRVSHLLNQPLTHLLMHYLAGRTVHAPRRRPCGLEIDCRGCR